MIFDHRLWLFGVSFHTWTFLVLLGTLAFDFLYKRKQGMPGHIALVHATALTTFTIHFYEIMHSNDERVFTGFQSPSMLIVNIPLALVALGVLCYIERPKPNKMTLPSLLVMLFFFTGMGVSGFFTSGFPKTWLWALSKLAASISTGLIFIPKGDIV